MPTVLITPEALIEKDGLHAAMLREAGQAADMRVLRHATGNPPREGSTLLLKRLSLLFSRLRQTLRPGLA